MCVLSSFLRYINQSISKKKEDPYASKWTYLLSCIFTLFSLTFLYSQITVYGYLKDELGKPVERANVDLIQSSQDLIADKIGYFQFVNQTPGTYQIVISKAGLETKTIEYTLKEGEKRKDLGVISLFNANQSTDLGILVLDDAISDSNGNLVQPMTRLLSAKRDVYQKNTTLELGLYNFVPRGVDNRYEEISFNGVPMSDPVDGVVDPIQWGGLSDITRNPSEVSENLGFSKYAFANLAGSLYYDTRASNFNKQTSLTYSFLNRNYKNRLMATYASGLKPSGWAFAFSLSKSWGKDGIIQGTEQDSHAYFASIEKKLTSRASINLTTFGAPTQRESYSANTKEVYELGGKNYNAYWGYDNGEKRNARVRNSYVPVVQLQYYQKLGESSQWNTTLSFQKGRDAQSRLSWREAPNPYPTYYAFLPSYVLNKGGSIEEAEKIKNRWLSDPSYYQINWDRMRQINENHLNDGARYLLVDDVKESLNFNFSSHFETELTPFWQLNLNLNYQNFKGHQFQEIKDLLGARYALNTYQLTGNQNYDSNQDSPEVQVEDHYKYDYELLRDQLRFNTSTVAHLDQWDLMASFFIGYSSSQRAGNYLNPYYLQNSKGKSAKIESLDTGVKARIAYNFSSRSQLSYSALLYNIAPELDNLFINPRIHNLRTPNIKNQVVSSNELQYKYNHPDLRISVSAFHTSIKNGTVVNRFYSDLYSDAMPLRNSESYVTEILSEVQKRYLGIEVAAEVRLLSNLKVFGIGSLGKYTYQNDPIVLLSTENETSALGYQDLGKASIKDLRIAGSPQSTATLGFRYSNQKLWWLGGSANFMADHYMDFFAANRTSTFYKNPMIQSSGNYTNGISQGQMLTPNNDLNTRLDQVKLKDNWLFNVDAGKTFNIGRYTLSLSLSVINLFNERKYITAGYEQIRNANYPELQRYSEESEPLYDTKFWYDRGRSFFANFNFKF